MRKEREAAPAIEPAEPAKNWFYADDPTGHVASIYFDEASTRLSEDDEDLREFPTEQSVRRQCNRSNNRANPEICRIVLNPPSEDPAAFGFPLENPERVVLSPDWYKLPDPASVLVHEAAHLLLGLRGHPTEVPHRDPYAIQGFVAALGSLRAGHSDRRYPPPAP